MSVVVGADQVRRAQGLERGAPGRGELATRILSSLVLAPLALGAAYIGSWPFVLLCAAAAIGIWWEWATLSGAARGGRAAPGLIAGGAGALILAAVFILEGWLGVTIAWLAAAAALVGALARTSRGAFVGGGLLYAGVMLVAPALLRGDPQYGFLAIVFLFAVVWATDIVAYFAGRAIGGPRLAPHLSPNKTWSGALGGALGAVFAAIAVAAAAGLGHWSTIAMVALGLSIASQAGDLFESAFKRWYGAKDASRLIPGHGGLMDRLDGFIAAALVAAILGLLRGGAEAPARALLVW